jgi:hypothetical protein
VLMVLRDLLALAVVDTGTEAVARIPASIRVGSVSRRILHAEPPYIELVLEKYAHVRNRLRYVLNTHVCAFVCNMYVRTHACMFSLRKSVCCLCMPAAERDEPCVGLLILVSY